MKQHKQSNLINAISKEVSTKHHNWITVVNPTNQRLLLQACDDCGVVKSENTVIQACKAAKGTSLISSSQNQTIKLAI